MTLADLRARVQADVTARFLPDTCTILTWLRQRDSRGGDDQRVGAPQVRASNVPCCFSPVTATVFGSESGGLYGPTAGRGMTLDTTATIWHLLVPYGTALSERDHVELTSGPAAGKRFEVISLEDATGFATLLGAKVVRAGVTNAETE